MSQTDILSMSSWEVNGNIATFLRGTKALFDIEVFLVLDLNNDVELGYKPINEISPVSILGKQSGYWMRELVNVIHSLDKSQLSDLYVRKCRSCDQYVSIDKTGLLNICLKCLKEYNKLTKGHKVAKDNTGEVTQISFSDGYLKSFTHIPYDELKFKGTTAKFIAYETSSEGSAMKQMHMNMDEERHVLNIGDETIVAFDLNGPAMASELFPFYDYMMALLLSLDKTR